MRVAFLGHDQPTCGFVRPSGGLLAKEDADQMVRELVAERISQKVIRALTPKSILGLRLHSQRRRYVPVKLPPREIENVKFKRPEEINSTVVRSRHLPRFREIYGDKQLELSLLQEGRNYLTDASGQRPDHCAC